MFPKMKMKPIGISQNTVLLATVAIVASIILLLLVGCFQWVPDNQSASKENSISSLTAVASIPAPSLSTKEVWFTCRVTDLTTDEPIRTVNVTLVGKSEAPHDYTTSDGIVRIPIQNPGGNPKVIFKAKGYKIHDEVINLPIGDDVKDIRLEPLQTHITPGSTGLNSVDAGTMALITKYFQQNISPGLKQTKQIRQAFNKTFSEQECDELKKNKKFVANYCRFCYGIANTDHPERFNRWFAKSSAATRRQFFVGIKRAVLSNDFRNMANQEIDKVDSDMEFEIWGDIVSAAMVDEIMKVFKTMKF